MRSRRYDYDFACPVEAAFDVIGGKWKGVILYLLLTRTIRYNELRRLLPGVTQRMLTLQLRELEQAGVVHREVYREVPPRVEYSLTELGQSLREAIVAMRTWGERYVMTRATTETSPRDRSSIAAVN